MERRYPRAVEVVVFRSLVIGIVAVMQLAAFEARTASAEPLKSGIDRANFDTSVKPGDNFYEYVNGEWIKQNPIPPEYSRWGAFPKLADDNRVALHEILEGLTKDSDSLSDEERKLRDFYRAAMDESAIEKLGATPLEAPLKKIDDVSDAKSLIVEVGRLHTDRDWCDCLAFRFPRMKSKASAMRLIWIRGASVCRTAITMLGNQPIQSEYLRNITSTSPKHWSCWATNRRRLPRGRTPCCGSRQNWPRSRARRCNFAIAKRNTTK